MASSFFSLDSLVDTFSYDKHWEKVHRIHLKTRRHSHVNICWMTFTVIIALFYFGVTSNVENDVACVVGSVPSADSPTATKFVRYESVSQAEAMKDELKIESIEDVSAEFQMIFNVIFGQAAVMVLCAFANFVSHYFVPYLLAYSKVIKFFNNSNMILMGAVSVIAITMLRLKPSSEFCIGAHLTEEEKAVQLATESERQFLIERGQYLQTYYVFVTALSSFFMGIAALFCFCNMGWAARNHH